MFEQTLNPTGHLWLTILAALIPLVALILMLAVFRVTAWLATIFAGIITVPVAVFVWHAPLANTLKSYLYGGLTGIWNIDWITFWGLIIFNTLVLTGNFGRFKNWMVHHATADIRIQTIMLAWAFGALLEGLVGFGYPWAVVVPILVGLGIADLDAIRVAALANNAPVSYGALGAPIIGLAAVTGLPLLALSASIGNVVAVLALLPPVGSDLSRQRMGRRRRGVAAGDRRLALLHRRPVAGRALSRSLSSRPQRRARFLLGSFPVRESLAPEDDSRLRWRTTRTCGDRGRDFVRTHFGARSISRVGAVHRADSRRRRLDRPVVARFPRSAC